jgi:hypothetical protein
MAPRAAVLSAFLLVGCFPPGEGLDPPAGLVYFPVGLAVDAQQKFLYVVNSDFDLQFNAGTVQSWELAPLRRRVPRYCESHDDCRPCPDDNCDPLKTVCDLYPEEETPDGEVVIENGGVPSNWCVNPMPTDGEPPSPCGSVRQQGNRSQSLYPGRCRFIDQTEPNDDDVPILPPNSASLGRSVVIGAFATDVVRRAPVAPPGWTILGDPVERLFIPVRGDATLHWIDIRPDGTLECGQDGNDGACDDRHRSGDRSSEESTYGDGRAAPEPFGIDADENGLSVLVSNQTVGAVSLFAHRRIIADDGSGVIEWDAGPRYVDQEPGLPDRPTGVAHLPTPLAMALSGRERPPGFLVTFRNAPVVSLVRVFDDGAADPAKPYVRRFESEVIRTNSSGIDSRGIGVDSFERKTNEQDCLGRFGIDEACAKNPKECPAATAEDFQNCLQRANATPLEVFIANRAPSSLVLGRSQPLVSDSITSDLPEFDWALPLDVGPARVAVGAIINEQGERERRVFTLCFDSRRIAIYDPERQLVETEVVTGRGPQAIAFDIGEDYAYAYVAHFLDSYIGVVDLDRRHKNQYGALIATIGSPTQPRASK